MIKILKTNNISPSRKNLKRKISFGILILILTLLIAPFVLQANKEPGFVDDGGIGSGGGGGSSGGNTGSNAGGPSGYTFCALENQRCSFSGTKDVAYGLNNFFNYKYKVVDGIDCNNSIFGDPNYGVAKACYTKDTTAIDGNSASSSSDLFVETYNADNITQTTARLHGAGGDKSTNPTLPLTGYFRYSKIKADLSPIFCNDIYGTNMTATKDIYLNADTDNKKCMEGGTYPNKCIPPASQPFYQNISNLSPNTTYYYCAIVSNKNNIAYGGSKIVKEFHTNCYETTVSTKDATNVKSTSAKLNGSYCSAKIIPNETDKYIEKVILSFEYRKDTVVGVSSPFTLVPGSEQNYEMKDFANLYGNIKFNLTGLTPNTRYEFRAVVKTADSDAEKKTTYGSPFLSFTTDLSPTGTDTGGSGCTSCVKLLPTVTVTATPSSIKSGESSTISWKSTNVSTCSVSGNENIDETAGSFNTGALTNSKSYSVTCTGANGTGGGNAYVYVNTTSVNGTCYDGIKNGNETDVDKGGRCGTGNTGPWWDTTNGGGSGTWFDGTGFGTWTTTWGTGGTGTVYWAGNGDGTGTWYSTTGNGTWTNGRKSGSSGTGTWTNLVLGQTATPPWDAIVRYHEGIETVFIRQIMRNPIFTQRYGYLAGMNLQIFAEDLADQFARAFGYVNTNRKEIRVSFPDIAAYQLQLIGNKLTVYEYYDNKIVDIRSTTATFKNKSDYEYYFKKN